jgi:iron complex transport system permease protein
VLIGALLSLSGCLLQGVTRNVLADPGLLGIHSGAHLALVLLLLLASPVVAGNLRIPVAFAGAIVTVALVFAAARQHGSTSRDILLIVGIAMGAALHAVGLLIAFSAPSEVLARAMVWTTGNLSGIGGREVTLLFLTLAFVTPVTLGIGKQMDLLALGDDCASSLGVSVSRVRLLALTLGVLGASVCVAVGGAITSVGLIAPNLARRLVGPRSRPLLLLSACCGATLVVLADTIGRTAFGMMELPAGILVAAVGTPYFLWLLVVR